MLVEIIGSSTSNPPGRCNMVGNLASQDGGSSVSPPSNPQMPHQSSRRQHLTSPGHCLSHSVKETLQISSKSVINQDGSKDDAGEPLEDPVACMNNDQAMPIPPFSRRVIGTAPFESSNETSSTEEDQMFLRLGPSREVETVANSRRLQG